MSTHHRTGRAATPSGRPPRTVPATGRPWSWRGIDLITAAMLAVAFGVVFWGFDTFVYPAVSAATTAFPPLGALTLGVWLVPAVVGGLAVRRPGAALFTELVAANVELFLGNKWGLAVLLSGVLQGLGVELVLAAGRWRRFGPATAVVGGIVAAVLEVVCYEWWAYTPDYSPGVEGRLPAVRRPLRCRDRRPGRLGAGALPRPRRRPRRVPGRAGSP